jgi:nucleoside-diphosphate-sugar epimerase
MASDKAFNEAVKGVSAVVHLATVTTMNPDPNKVIPPTIASVLNAPNSANNEPSVKQFVCTSSAAAAVLPAPNTEFHCDETSWNNTAVELAWAPSPYDPSRAMIAYMASKVEAEKALWKFVAEAKPNFTVNAVLPFTAFGKVLNKHQAGSTAAWIQKLYHGDISLFSNIPVRNSFFP